MTSEPQETSAGEPPRSTFWDDLARRMAVNGPRTWLRSWRQRREQKRIRAILASLPPGPTSAEALMEYEAPFARYYSERWVMYSKAAEDMRGLVEQAMESEDSE